MLNTPGNVVKGNQSYAVEILRDLPVMSYWPFTECQQIYNQAIYQFQRERISKWAMWFYIVLISRQDWLENVVEKQADNFYFKNLRQIYPTTPCSGQIK